MFPFSLPHIRFYSEGLSVDRFGARMVSRALLYRHPLSRYLHTAPSVRGNCYQHCYVNSEKRSLQTREWPSRHFYFLELCTC
jgi:hypothetical protein